jgi:hypothetical protein
MIRIYLEGDIENVSNDAVNDANQEIRTSITVTLEGYWMDYLTQFRPVLWYVGIGQEKEPVPPDILDAWLVSSQADDDVRVGQANPVILDRGHLPPAAT